MIHALFSDNSGIVSARDRDFFLKMGFFISAQARLAIPILQRVVIRPDGLNWGNDINQGNVLAFKLVRHGAYSRDGTHAHTGSPAFGK